MHLKIAATNCGVILLVIISMNGFRTIDGANILGLCTTYSASHLIIHMSIMKALAERGHNVTMVTTVEPKIVHENIHYIYLPIATKHKMALEKDWSMMANQKISLWSFSEKFLGKNSTFMNLQTDALKDPKFTRLYSMPDIRFDVVIMGYLFNDFAIGVAAKFKCPVIISWMLVSVVPVNALIGNPIDLSYVPISFFVSTQPGEVMGFRKRLQNLLIIGISKLADFAHESNMNEKYTELFGDDSTVPPYKEMRKNVSLLFCNSHFSEGLIRPNVPGVIEIGGIQIKDKPDPLPKDIGSFLDTTEKDGAILFSLGTNIKSADIRPEIIKIIFQVLSGMKQKVIWKWENLEKTPGNSPNILYKKWMPQDDILAHPNVKLFITHAGKGGIAESQYHGVPMVALPIFGDQQSNAHKMVSAGYGLQLDLPTLTAEDFKKAVVEVLSNSSYAENVKKFSDLYRDRPMSAKETAVYWTEYVIRHKGARHMQSPLVHLKYFEIHNYDVIAFLIIIVYLVFKIAKIIFRFIFAKLFNTRVKAINGNTKKVQ